MLEEIKKFVDGVPPDDISHFMVATDIDGKRLYASPQLQSVIEGYLRWRKISILVIGSIFLLALLMGFSFLVLLWAKWPAFIGILEKLTGSVA